MTRWLRPLAGGLLLAQAFVLAVAGLCWIALLGRDAVPRRPEFVPTGG